MSAVYICSQGAVPLNFLKLLGNDLVFIKYGNVGVLILFTVSASAWGSHVFASLCLIRIYVKVCEIVFAHNF
jgi:hypothetical protein